MPNNTARAAVAHRTPTVRPKSVRHAKLLPSLFPSPATPEHPPRDTDTSGAPLPPERQKLVGLARLAASAPKVEEKRGTEYFLLPVRSVLNVCRSERVPFAWTVNPYRGCEFGCRYCYARYTHEYLELSPEAFERQIFVKQNAGECFAADLARQFAVRTQRGGVEHIAIGAATDPYQPAERRFGNTRAILEQIAARPGLSVSVTTKSDQIVRDLDVLQRIAAHSALTINISVTTLRPRLARWLEPRAPRPDLRLAAVRRLREAGLAVGVFAMPVLPGLTDRAADLDALARAAREADACWFCGQVLFLMPASRKVFLPFLEAKFPRLARTYRRWYSRNGYAPEQYREQIALRFAELRAKYGLAARPQPMRPHGTNVDWETMHQKAAQLELLPDGNECTRACLA